MLGNRPLERELLKLLRLERRKYPALRREDRAARRRRSVLQDFEPLTTHWPLMCAGWALQARKADLIAPILGLWLLRTAAARAARLQDELRAGPEVAVLGTLPAADEVIYSMGWRRMALRALWMVPAFCVASLIFVQPPDAMAAVVGALAAYAVVLAGATALGRESGHAPRLRGGLTLLLLWLGLGARYVPESLAKGLEVAVMLSPPGWPLLISRHLSGPSLLGGMAVLLLAAVAATWALRRRERERYEIAELVWNGSFPFALFPGEEGIPAGLEDVQETACGGDDVGGQITPVIDVTAGPIERAVDAALSPSDLPTLGLLLGEPPSWSRAWMTGVKWCGAGIGLLVLTHSRLALFPLGIGLLLVVPLLGGLWPGLQPLPISALSTCSMLATLPVSYRHASRVMILVLAIRGVAALPVLGAAALALDAAGVAGLEESARVVAGWVALLPLITACKFAAGADSGAGLRWRSVVVLGAMAPLVVGALLAAIALVVGWQAGIAGVVLVVLSLAAWHVYGVLWDRGWLDLIGRVDTVGARPPT